MLFQNCQAYVNGAVRMRLDNGPSFTVLEQPSLVFGGISKTLVCFYLHSAYFQFLMTEFVICVTYYIVCQSFSTINTIKVIF